MKHMYKFSVVLLFLTVFLNTYAQKDKTLFSIDGDNISQNEFQRVYEKNLSIITVDSQKDITNYLDLFINYKLKLKEAYDLQMDTLPSYLREYEKYKNQLIAPYLKDENKEKDLVKEAYKRLQKEINASHILIRLPKNATPKDTLTAYKKLEAARKRIIDGESFEKVAQEVSEDPSAKKNAGKLGYFTVFQMVYPFETAAYNTPIGKVSPIFKTRFGYHILKVNDIRKARGEVEVAHIMLKGFSPSNKSKIFKIKDNLDKGASFEQLAKQFSQDAGSAKNGGKLPKFGSSRMVKEFEDVAFSLKNEGTISEPFKTAYGWHIVKLLKKYPIQNFEVLEPGLKKKVAQGKRAKIIGTSIERKLLKDYSFDVNSPLFEAFKQENWRNNIDLQSSLTFMRMQEKLFSVSDFYKFYKNHITLTPNKALTAFKKEKALAYYKIHLADNFPELGYTLKEYQEGLLLFDLMQKRIWEKAEKDTIGLKNYFNSHRDQYKWDERVKCIIVTTSTQNEATKAYNLLLENTDLKKIEKQFSGEALNTFKEGIFEKKASVFPKYFRFIKGVSKPIKQGKQFVIISVLDTIPPQAKELEEVKGKIISDYQDYLEQQWIKNLKDKYSVHINKETFNKLKEYYQD